MRKLVSRALIAAMTLCGASLAIAADEGSWTGWVTETHCGAAGAKEAHADCANKCVKEKGAKWALYNPADKGVYVLSNQEAAGKMAAKQVTIKGKLDAAKKTIEVASMEPAAK